MHNVIEEYLMAKGTVAPTVDSRAVALDLPAPVVTQVAGIGYTFR